MAVGDGTYPEAIVQLSPANRSRALVQKGIRNCDQLHGGMQGRLGHGFDLVVYSRVWNSVQMMTEDLAK